MLTDPIADMLTRIRNAYKAQKIEVILPHSKPKEAVAKVLKQYKFVGEVKVAKEGQKKFLAINLVYDADEKPSVEHIKRISKPGRRVYIGAKDIRSPLGGYGITIMSTSKGVMSNLEAKKQNLGGEMICEVW